MSEKLACRSCGSTELADLGKCDPYSKDSGRFSDEPGRLYRCRKCGLGFRHPVPDESTLASTYRETPVEAMEYLFEENAAWLRARLQLEERLKDAEGPMVLDIGCHTGKFLSHLLSNWRKYGIESANEPVRVAVGVHGVTIIGERLESIDNEWFGRFDAVTMFDVVEHLVDPAAGIRQAARMLKPGGVLILSSADFDAWTWRWLGGGHWYLQTPQHLSILSLRFLKYVAARHLLKLTEVSCIPHRHATLAVRFREMVFAIYWGLRRRRGVYRFPHRLIQSLPGFRGVRHMQAAPWTMSVSDHFLATYER